MLCTCEKRPQHCWGQLFHPSLLLVEAAAEKDGGVDIFFFFLKKEHLGASLATNSFHYDL